MIQSPSRSIGRRPQLDCVNTAGTTVGDERTNQRGADATLSPGRFDVHSSQLNRTADILSAHVANGENCVPREPEVARAAQVDIPHVVEVPLVLILDTGLWPLRNLAWFDRYTVFRELREPDGPQSAPVLPGERPDEGARAR
jgi:hypothetical protein